MPSKAEAESDHLFSEVSDILNKLQSGKARPRTVVRERSAGHFSVGVVVEERDAEEENRVAIGVR